MKILVCDDQDIFHDVEQAIRATGQPDIELVPLVTTSLKTALTSLFHIVKACLEPGGSCSALSGLPFDDMDIVILDNNLAHLDVEGARLTAESIAGYVRAFTGATYIISLNKNSDVDFDLRYLVGDYSTRTDVALNVDHLENLGLWTGKPSDAKAGFLPWYWPRLVTMAPRRRAQVDFVETHLDDPLLTALGFPDEAIDFLSRHARGALYPEAESNGGTGDGKPFKNVTFRDVFIARDRSLPGRNERESLSNAEKAGSVASRRIIARVVAADIDLWFRRDVIGPQEALVDVPHLLMRLPFLLGQRAGALAGWNDSVVASTPPFGLEQKLYTEHLAKARFAQDIWIPSPSFWWPMLRDDEKLNELMFGAKPGQWLDAVFCEDCSAFLERSPKNGGAAATEFSAEFEGSWGRRHVAQLQGFHYTPRSRFAVRS